MKRRTLHYYPDKWRGIFLPLLLVLCIYSVSAHAQQQVVTGTIVDENNASMPGVSVLVKGTTTGTTSDAEGKYSLTVADPANTILVYSFIGYGAQEVSLNNRTVLDITMQPSVESLTEVVVVGYGTQRKRDVTGAIVSVNADALREVPAANLQQGLQGRAAGLEVQQVGTTPGSGAQIRIRGERSILGSNNPLIVVDGIPFENGSGSLGDANTALNDINPNDIASIEVLKDASATAIYGSRGANGVILVTTKRGKSGPTRVTLSTYYGVASVAREYPVFNAAEYRALRDISPWPNGYMAEELPYLESGQSTNWQDEMYENGYITDNNLSLAGGNDNNQFSAGVGYFKQTTVLPGQDFTRYTLKATNDFKVGERLKIGISTMNNVQVTNGSQFVNPMFPLLSLSPLMPSHNPDGSLVTAPTGNLDDRGTTYNPLLLKNNRNNWVDQIRRFRTFNSMYAEYKIMEGLSYKLNVGADYRRQENNQFQGADSQFNPSYFRPGRGNTASVNNTEGWGYTIENIVTYDKTIADKHRVSVTALYSNQSDNSHNNYIQKDSIDADFIQFYNLGQSKQSTTNLPTYNGGEVSWDLISYMLRVNYVFDDRFMVTLTGRRDGSSRLAKGHKYHQYPAVSLGWNVTNEAFMDNVSQISNLKLRLGYGETSNQSVNPYSALGGVSNTIANGTLNVPIKYNFGNQIVSGYYVSTVPNPNLDWEYTRTLNIGLDFGILNNRITGSLDYYEAKTNKILYGLALPATSGVPNPFNSNIGKMENKGIELSLASVNMETPSGFTWSTDLNIFYNRNELLSLNEGFVRNIANGLYIGEPLSAIFDYRKLGIWQIDEAAEAATFGQVPGQLKLEDISGPDGVPDGKIDSSDKTVIGSGQAKWQGGITNRFAYKNFDFSFVTYARFGGLVVSGVHQPLAAYITNLDGRRNSVKVDYWTPTNPTNDFPMPSASTTPAGATDAWTTLGYYDASFVKIRSITFGYTLPAKVIEKINAHSIRFYLQAQNPLLLYSPYVRAGGIDPEATGTGTTGFVSNGGNIPTRALTIAAATPPTKSFIIGANISF